MRTTIVRLAPDGQVQPVVDDDPVFAAMPEFEGKPLDRVRLHDLEQRGRIELQLIEIAAGGRFAMHSSPKLAFCHVVRGAGTLGFPDASMPYQGPETFVFHPGTLHRWYDITADTLMAVAIVPDEE